MWSNYPNCIPTLKDRSRDIEQEDPHPPPHTNNDPDDSSPLVT